MDKKFKISYEPPKVTDVAFQVENGLQVSGVNLDHMLFNPFGDDSWDAPSSSSTTSHFGSGDWTGGSSFSSNSTFGSGSWDE